MSSIQPSLPTILELPGVGSSAQAVQRAAQSLHEFLDGKTEHSKQGIDPYKKP
jgi:hypothetical protein